MVLILVLMDDALVPTNTKGLLNSLPVLILVLMDDALVLDVDFGPEYDYIVLILVLMDDALVHGQGLYSQLRELEKS